ncbi:cell cycle control protein [Rutstroemia sp. NJR-2017a WRK4]|nr:cell cycle control protein [Rutstroemia sp. NJR-2017a WRK4]
MEDWSAESRDHRKRSFAEMSHPVTLSSSPVLLEQPTNYGAASTRLPPDDNGLTSSIFDRRRTSHPHNLSSQNYPRFTRPSQTPSPDMEPARRPRLEHRTSQTIIDLTDEPDDVPSQVRRAPRSNPSLRPPPTLGRSDARRIEQVVDLTADEDDIVFSHARELPGPRLAGRRRLAEGYEQRFRAAEEFLNGNRPSPPILNNSGPAAAPERERRRPQPGGLGHFLGHGNFLAGIQNYMGLGGGPAHEHIGVHLMADFAPMAGIMDYQSVALQDRKPEHVPPPAVEEGFTRSPQETDVAICPSCELELIHRKDGEEQVTKKSGRAPTRKDREEHPFWVVKDCGHHRNTPDKSPISTNFRASSDPRAAKKILCSVDSCESDVRTKDKWVGIFL